MPCAGGIYPPPMGMVLLRKMLRIEFVQNGKYCMAGGLRKAENAAKSAKMEFVEFLGILFYFGREK